MTFQINLLGTSFTIKTDEDPDYLKQIMWYLEKKTNETASSVNIQDPLKISVLTSMTLVDELLKMHNNNGQSTQSYSKIEEQKIEQTTHKLMDDLDKALED